MGSRADELLRLFGVGLGLNGFEAGMGASVKRFAMDQKARGLQ